MCSVLGVAIRRIQVGICFAALLLLSCRSEPFEPIDYNGDWTEASHGRVAPNYGVVLPEDSVNRIDIYLTAAGWAAVRKRMTELWGFDFGAGTHPCCGPYPADPDYVDVEVRFRGKVWKHVGFRLKGNSTLHYAWNAGNYKLPFRLRFDAFEEAYPETWNQRLFGFRELSMSANIFDDAMVRERLASHLFRAGGVPAPRAASYRVYIDFGNGLEYNGVYTALELPEDTMVLDQLGENGGNLYKPESTFGAFVETEFERQNNHASQDYSDVKAVIAAINNTSVQASNPAQWRANLEAAFNVNGFLRWLAVNNAIASWDAYGHLAHNYYVYNHSTKKLTWIPWDHNRSFVHTPGVVGAVPKNTEALSLTMNEVDARWPLIRYIADDPVYFGRYRTYLQAFYNTAFTQEATDALIAKYSAMIFPYVIGPNGEIPGHRYISTADEFNAAVAAVHRHVFIRRATIEEFLLLPSGSALGTRSSRERRPWLPTD
jgi:spore coat protein H